MAKEVTIYGAGLSGLVAAINLVKEGYDVTVHDKEGQYGGSRIYNPSLHMTPMDTKKTSEYIDIDISSCFKPIEELLMYYHDLRCGYPSKGLFAVERGDSYWSLDTVLYNEAKALGVKFEWKSILDKKTLDNLPPNTIIACGFDAATYKYLEIPYAIFEAWQCYGSVNHQHTRCWSWMDECITEYGYYTTVNGTYFDLLFSNGKAVSKEALKKYEDFQFRNLGIEHEDNWHYVVGASPVGGVPTNGWKKPTLFVKNAIMAGTMAGCIDPFFGFGISGGLVSGKTAAMAITNPEQAQHDFNRFNRWWSLLYPVKRHIWWKFIRPHVTMLEWSMRLAGPERLEWAMNFMFDHGISPPLIPGYNVMGCN